MKALESSGLGFASRGSYSASRFDRNEPTERASGAGVTAGVPGGIALGPIARAGRVGSTRFRVDGRYDVKEEKQEGTA